MSLFVDSSCWFAAAVENDRYNERARRLLMGGERLVTSDLVLVETWLLLARKFNQEVAERFWGGLRQGIADIERVLLIDFDAAWQMGVDYADQPFSIVDRTSFAVMERLDITRVATFDRHFAIYRFGRTRKRAFEIVR